MLRELVQNQNVLDQYGIIDGFLLNTQLRCNLKFKSMAIQGYEALRRSGNYRSRAWVIPQDPANIVIPARDAIEFQVSVHAGSAIWGYTFLATAGLFSFQVTDTCTDVPSQSEVLVAQALSAGSKQAPFSKLMVVSRPGLLNVQICSLATVDTAGIQLILWGGEPNEAGVCSK